MSVDYVPVPSLDEVDQRRSGSELERTENLHQPRDDAAVRPIHRALELLGMKLVPRAQEPGMLSELAFSSLLSLTTHAAPYQGD
jgi:hypothetical protein